jgi:hypothetical protein
MSDYRPGTVAVATVNVRRGGKDEDRTMRVVRFAAGWAHCSIPDEFWMDSEGRVTDIRPLVVIDPEDCEQVERLMRTAFPHGIFPAAADEMQRGLREFANPTPPKPEEPTGLGAVVEDAEGERWIRVDWTNPWCRAKPQKRNGGEGLVHRSHLPWERIAAVKVLSEGVQP